jgi:hypothetical protein
VKWNLDRDPQAAARLKQIGDAFEVEDPTVPSFYLFRQLISGFDGAETTGRQIEKLFTIDVYWREGCPRCTTGKRYLATLSRYFRCDTTKLHATPRRDANTKTCRAASACALPRCRLSTSAGKSSSATSMTRRPVGEWKN